MSLKGNIKGNSSVLPTPKKNDNRGSVSGVGKPPKTSAVTAFSGGKK